MGWKAYCVFVSEDGSNLAMLPKHDSMRANEILKRLELNEYASKEITSFNKAIYPRGENKLYLGAYPGAFLLCSQEVVYDFFFGFTGGIPETPSSEIISTAQPGGVVGLVRRIFSRSIGPEPHLNADMVTQVIENQIRRNMVEELDGEPRPWVGRLLKAYPSSTIDAVMLQSVSNLWGYACFRSSIRIRTRAGSGDFGTVVEMGTVQPFEESLYAKEVYRDGERGFVSHIRGKEELSPDHIVGEEFVVRLIEQWFGGRNIYEPSTGGSEPDPFDLEVEMFQKGGE